MRANNPSQAKQTMDAAFLDLISRTKDNIRPDKFRNGDTTHVILVPQQSFVAIRRDKTEEFWRGYCRLAYKGNGVYSLAEINTKDMPVLALFTFQFNKDTIDGDDIVNEFLIAELVYVWQQAIITYLQISDSEAELTCVALESEYSWEDGNSILYQIRIQFPLCKTEASMISRIREKAISSLRRRNSVQLLKVTPEGDWDKIIDTSAHLEPLTLYKSIKAINRPKLVLSSIYDKITDDITRKTVEKFSVDQAFLPKSHSHVGQGLVGEDIFESDDPDESDPLFWLPMILSIGYSNSIVLPRGEDDPRSNTKEPIIGFTDTASAMTKSQFFLQYVSVRRANDEFDWRDIGRSLHNSSEGGEDGLEEWIRFSEQSDCFDRDDCTAIYHTFEIDTHITYKTLAWFASKDSPLEYKSWHDAWCEEALERALKLHHTDVAEYIYRRYWLEVACAHADKSLWYVFNGTRWHFKQKAVVLADRIRTGIIPGLERLRTEICKRVEYISNHADKQPDEARIKCITSLIEKLCDQRFIQSITKTAIVPFHIEYERFLDFADNNPSLMGHGDCVTEADERGIRIRPGKPEDYITMTTGLYLMRGKYNWDHPQVMDVMEWLGKVHTDKELRKEFLKECASWLRGRNINKRISIWTGHKNNSKSMLIRCLELGFGQYFGKFPTSLVTGRRTQSSNACPELARSKGKHTMIIQETDEDVEAFKKGILKELSGNDSIFSRGLYETGAEFIPMFKLVIVCNKPPNFTGKDSATEDRVRIKPFLSTFDDKAPDDINEQYATRHFKVDPHFEIKLPALAPALFWILIQYYPKYLKEGLREPKVVREYTEKYWRDQDIYSQYLDECLEIKWADEDETEPDTSYAISHAELYRHFKRWLQEFAAPNTRIPALVDSKTGFARIIPDFQNKKWIGVKINDMESTHDI